MYYIATSSSGAALYAITTGGVVTALTIPSGIALSPVLHPRILTFNGQIFLARSGTVNFWIDPLDNAVRPMHIPPPTNGPLLAAGSSTGLTGTYRGAVAYFLKDPTGAIVNLSPLSPVSPAVAISGKDLAWTNIPTYGNTSLYLPTGTEYIFGRRLYRTTNAGASYFALMDLDDNATTAINNAMVDSQLSLLPAAVNLSNPPGAITGTGFSQFCVWKNRLFGVTFAQVGADIVWFTEVNQFYGWSVDNQLKTTPQGADNIGVSGFLPRRNSLGILKRDRVLKLIGTSADDFEVVTVNEGVGSVSGETCVVIRDVAYFLGNDGVYTWDDDGLKNISEDSVHPWFTTDTYFNRALFGNAFAKWNPYENTYELHLAAAGSSNIDRWVSYSIERKMWLGPNKTAAFTPSSVGLLLDSIGGSFLPVIAGTDGYIYNMNTTGDDIPGGGAAVAIDAFVNSRWFFQNDPEVTKYWGELRVFNRIESGGTMTITPYLGGLGAAAGATISHDMTKDRERLRRIGVGRLLQLKFAQAATGRKFQLYGGEIDPVYIIGAR